MSNAARLLLIAGFASVTLVCTLLGVWQLNRLGERRESNRLALAARSSPSVTIEATTEVSPSLDGREVHASGRYDHTHDVVLRGRAYKGSPGVEIVSPLVLEGGRRAVVVNRGFMPTPDAVTVQTDSVREFGTVQVRGMAMAMPSGNGQPLERQHRTTWVRLDLEELGARMPYQLAPVYIRQAPDSGLPAFPRRLDPIPIDDGPHLSYAIQWFAFAVMAVVFGVVVVKQQRAGEKRETRA